MATGGFTLTPELRSFLDAFESKHGTTVETSAGWGHQNAFPQTVLPDPLVAGAIPPGQEVSPQVLLQANQQAVAGYAVPAAPPAAAPPPPPPLAPPSMQPALPAAPPDPNRLEGVVIDWRESYGFVQFNDGRRAYVHNSMCGGTSLLPGQAITGVCVPDTKNPGKWQAQQVQRKINVTMDGRMEGKVQQWTGNFGFIQFCDGRRAFCHTSFLTGAAVGSMLCEGQTVVGTVQEDPKNPGKWQAQQVEVLPSLAPDNSGRIEGKVVQWNGSYGFIQFSDGRRAYVHSSVCANANTMGVGATVFGNLVEDPGNPGRWQAQNVEGEPGRLEGIVAQWSEKGFGFIDFVDGRHAFVHSSACGGKHLSQGEAVSAVITADQLNPGKWMAKSVIVKGPPGEDCTVTEWHEDGAWGFVLLDSGSTAFIHSSSFGGGGNLAIGMRLRVTTKYDVAKARMIVEQVTGVAELSVQQATEAAKLAVAAQAAQDAEASVAAGLPALPDAGAAVAAPVAAPAIAAGAVDPAAAAAAALAAAAPPPPPPPLPQGLPQGLPGVPGVPAAQAAVAPPTMVAAPAAAVPAPGVPAMPNLSGEISSLASSLGLTMPGLSGPSIPETQLSLGIRTAGKVSEWNASGFGFAMMDDGRRVYVHTSQCGGQHLQQGEGITAVVVPDPRNLGKWAAQSVERLGGAVPAVAAGFPQAAAQGGTIDIASAVASATLLAEQAAKRQRLGL